MQDTGDVRRYMRSEDPNSGIPPLARASKWFLQIYQGESDMYNVPDVESMVALGSNKEVPYIDMQNRYTRMSCLCLCAQTSSCTKIRTAEVMRTDRHCMYTCIRVSLLTAEISESMQKSFKCLANTVP
jgi:hypothetical protein